MRLCDDEIWTVRRACAEVMPIMALLCTLEKRRKVLVPAMKKFMFDPSQWVIMAALKVSFYPPILWSQNSLESIDYHRVFQEVLHHKERPN